MAQGEVSVALHLIIADALRQAKDAAKAINKEFGIKGGTGDMGAVAAGTNKAAAAQKNLHAQAVKTNKALSEQTNLLKRDERGRFIRGTNLKPAKLGLDFKPIPEPKVIFTDNPSDLSPKPDVTGKSKPSIEPKQGDAYFSGSGLSKGKIDWEGFIRKRREMIIGKFTDLEMSRDKTAFESNNPKFSAARLGIPIEEKSGKAPASGMMGSVKSMRDITLPIGQLLASFYVISRAISAALAPLKMFAKMVMQAAEAARKLYANALMSGMGIGMTVKRNMLADILGVSENDIFQFGKQIAYLQPQLKDAEKILEETNKPLTQLTWEWKILKIQIQAATAQLASVLFPFIEQLIESLKEFAKAMNIQALIGGAVLFLIKMVEVFETAVETFTLGLAVIAGAIIHLLHVIAVVMDTLHLGSSGSVFLGKLAKSSDKEVLELSESVGKQWKNLTSLPKPYSNKIPDPQSYMKQMPASAWERMGLQVGGTGGTNYAAKTADSTAKSATYLQRLLEAAHNAGRMTITRGMALPSAP
jgi:hypothetical protein